MGAPGHSRVAPRADTPTSWPLVIEAGGTSLRVGLFDPRAGALLRRQTGRTPGPEPGESPSDHHWRVMCAIHTLAQSVVGQHDVEVVGLAYPGPIDADGWVLAAPTVLRHSKSEPFDLRAACRALWPGSRVLAMNDLTAAGYRYVASGRLDFAVLTVGSGIGHKVFLDGRPRVGEGRGGEIGHLRLDFSEEAPRCDCGGQGHLGALASGRGTVAMVKRCARRDPVAYRASWLGARWPAPEDLDGPAVAAAFGAADPFTTAAVQVSVRYLGQALAAVHLDTGVEDIVLLGGFATAMGERYRRLVVEGAAAACWQIGQNWDRILTIARPQDDAALIGVGMAASGGVETRGGLAPAVEERPPPRRPRGAG